MDNQLRDHWDSIYKCHEVNEVGWYEENPVPCLKLLSKCNIKKHESIVDVGAGASTLIDCLVKKGFNNITAVDISQTAINKLKDRLGEKTSAVKFLVDDINQPTQMENLRNVSLWHDRALLHFFTEEKNRLGYLATLKRAVKKDGYVIISVFSLKGAEMCAGLKVRRYDQNMLAEFLGSDFKSVDYFEYLYHMPSGDTRPYLYTLFQRIKV